MAQLSKNYNLRNPEEGEVADMYEKARVMRLQKMKYKVLSQIMQGKKDVDLTVSPQLFEALNKERMDFETILKLHPDQVKEAMDATMEDRACIDENKYWSSDGAKWAILGHIPPCCYHARPPEYWANKDLLKLFFNMFTKFRISTRTV
jgi:hypothetical protein